TWAAGSLSPSRAARGRAPPPASTGRAASSSAPPAGKNTSLPAKSPSPAFTDRYKKPLPFPSGKAGTFRFTVLFRNTEIRAVRRSAPPYPAVAAAEQPRPAPGQDGEHRQHQQNHQQSGQKQQG